jgi:hypothetical protein
MVILATAAFAGSLDGLAPLPACEAGEVQLVLPTRVFDLAFDDTGRLWVADWSGLSVRDDQLIVRDVPAPGSHGWVELVERNGDLVAENMLGAAWPPNTFLDDAPLVAANHARILANHRPREDPLTAEGAEFTWSGPRRGQELLGTPWTPSAAPDPNTAARRLAGAVSWDRRAVHALAVREDGTVATADTGGITLYGPDGSQRAHVPMANGSTAAGLVRDRLFTVDEGRLRLWGADGATHRQIPGHWTDAAAHRDDLIATDAEGILWTIDLDRGRRRRPICLLDDCDPPAPPRRPTGGTTRELGPRAAQWRADLHQWAQAHPERPMRITVTDDHVVVAELDPVLHEVRDLEVIQTLHVLDRKARRRLVRHPLDTPTLARVEAAEAGVVELVGPDRTITRHRLPDLTPVDGEAPRRPGLRVDPAIPLEPVEVAVGSWEGARFTPAPGLPPRHAMQQRLTAAATFTDDRMVIHSPPVEHHITPGSTEVWCRPPVVDAPATVSPGILASRLRRLRPVAPDLTPPPPRPPPMSAPVRDWLVDATQEPTWFFAPQPGLGDLPSVLALSLDRLVVHSNAPRPADLPEDVGWRHAEVRLPGLTLVEQGVRVWAGPLEHFDPLLLETASAPRPVSDAVRAAWEEAFAERRTEPFHVPAFTLQHHLAAGEDDEARAILAAEPRTSASLAETRRLYVGRDFPMETIRWDRAPGTSTFLLGPVFTDGRRVWDRAAALGVAGAVITTQTVHPGLASGRWSGMSHPAARAGRYVLVRDGRIVRILDRDAPLEAFE